MAPDEEKKVGEGAAWPESGHLWFSPKQTLLPADTLEEDEDEQEKKDEEEEGSLEEPEKPDVWFSGAKGYWSVLFFQQVASIGNNITIQIVAGLSMKSIYLKWTTDSTSGMTLQHFIIIFGCAELILSQFSDIHSLHFLNALCTCCTIGFFVSVVALCAHALRNGDATGSDYSILGSPIGMMYGVFAALGTVAFSFGDAMLPKIQATLREPAKANIYKGSSLHMG